MEFESRRKETAPGTGLRAALLALMLLSMVAVCLWVVETQGTWSSRHQDWPPVNPVLLSELCAPPAPPAGPATEGQVKAYVGELDAANQECRGQIATAEMELGQ